jgi:RecA-family ATPase
MRDMPYGEVALTGMYEALAKIVDPASVLILDGTSDLYGASEIVRRHVRRFVRALRRLVNRDGAVLLLAHIDKAAARDGSTSDRYSGSTAWHNSVRARWSLASDEDGTGLTLALAKANLAQAGAEVRFRWSPEAHLYVAEATSEGGIVGAIRERQEREGILAALQASVDPVPAAATGQRTAWHVLSARPELPASLRDGREGKRRFWRLIEQMRQMGTIREASIRRSNRHNLATLEAADIGSAPNAPNA